MKFKHLFKACLAVSALTSFSAGTSAFAFPVQDPNISSDDFMAAMAKQPGVTQLPDGLSYKIIQSGPESAPQPEKGATVSISYKGQLPDGTVFDASNKHSTNGYMTMSLANVIPGWQEIVPMMHVGDSWEVYIPAELAYGSHAVSIIPANSPLVFNITLGGV
ncbi:FKBP-type peptidyl-prolyl cis-trans isomerase [Acetobacteraceae bacterium]|nr:FKBP-type peptidyl-prolyl cis-trans isomerase [Acetobacteraceae bacterium]